MPQKPITRSCEQCASSFLIEPRKIRGNYGRFCSRQCFSASTTGQPRAARASLEERFWTKVQKSSEPDGCWLWIGGRNSEGYGLLWDHRVHTLSLATHISLELAGRPLARSEWALHSCPGGDNPACVNPDHLRPGDRTDNVRDMWGRGRSNLQKRPDAIPRGQRVGTSKLTDVEVLAIRQRFDDGEARGALATAFGVSLVTICRIVNREGWKHV